MKISRTFDDDFIVECAQSCWDKVTDDGSPSQDMFFPNTSPHNYWLCAEDDGIKYGVFLFHPHNYICYEVHTMLLPIAHGKAVEAATAAGNWMFDNTPCQRIITNVPDDNELARILAQRVGMKMLGINKKSLLKFGILKDQIMFGISKGE